MFGVPTAYALNQLSAVHLNAAINQGLLIPDVLGNSVLYERAARILGDKVLLTRTVAFAHHTNTSITLVVTSSADDSSPKPVKAKKLANTIPPILSNIAPLDLDQHELSIFQHRLCQSAYVGVIRATGLPDGLELVNFSPNASVLNLPGVDGQPHVSNIVFSGFPGIVGGPALTADGARALVSEAAEKIAQAGTYNMTDPQWLAFASHTPLQCRFDGENIKAGLYA